MYPTMELRWFFPGASLKAIQTWFHSTAGTATDEGQRQDCYLSLPKLTTLGIKQRQDAIEIKQRLGKGKGQRLGNGVKGRIEHWVKWSFSLDSQQSQPNLALPPNAWITIQKARQLKRYAVLPDGSVTVITDDETSEPAEQNCTLELTNLWLGNQRWHSLGLEASGPEDQLGETLLRVTQAVFSGSGPPLLKSRDSYGYPKWLARLQKEQAKH